MVVGAPPKPNDAQSERPLRPATDVSVTNLSDAVSVVQQRQELQPATSAPPPSARTRAVEPEPQLAPIPVPGAAEEQSPQQPLPRTPDSEVITPAHRDGTRGECEEAINVDAEEEMIDAAGSGTATDTDNDVRPAVSGRMETGSTANGTGNANGNGMTVNEEMKDVSKGNVDMDVDDSSESSSASERDIGVTGSRKRRRRSLSVAESSTGVVSSGNASGGGGGSSRLSNRVTALALTAEMLCTACTHWLIEESHARRSNTSSAARAMEALRYARTLFGDVNSYGRRAGVLDEVRRELAAAQPERALDYDWARPDLSLEPARSNYDSWEPMLNDREWSSEKKVLRFIRAAMLYAVDNGENTPHLYAPILLVAISVADRAVQYAIDHQPNSTAATTTANANVNSNNTNGMSNNA